MLKAAEAAGHWQLVMSPGTNFSTPKAVGFNGAVPMCAPLLYALGKGNRTAFQLPLLVQVYRSISVHSFP